MEKTGIGQNASETEREESDFSSDEDRVHCCALENATIKHNLTNRLFLRNDYRIKTSL